MFPFLKTSPHDLDVQCHIIQQQQLKVNVWCRVGRLQCESHSMKMLLTLDSKLLSSLWFPTGSSCASWRVGPSLCSAAASSSSPPWCRRRVPSPGHSLAPTPLPGPRRAGNAGTHSNLRHSESLWLFCTPTRIEQLMRALRSWALASIWKSALLWSACRLRVSRSRLMGSETPPVKSTSASVVFPPSRAS